MECKVLEAKEKQDAVTSNRLLYPDILKAVAILGVIIIHMSASGFSQYNILTVNWYMSLFWGSIVRWSVPVFFMCSGVFFLNKDKEIRAEKIFTKYIFRILIALIFWSSFYESLPILMKYRATGVIGGQQLMQALKNLLTGNTHYHLYFLYIIILIYALVPLMRVFIQSAEKRDIEYLLIFWFVFAVAFPLLKSFYPFSLIKGIMLQYSVNMTYGMIGYFVAGYYFSHFPIKKSILHLTMFLGVLGFIVTFFGTVLGTAATGKASSIFLQGMTPNVMIMAFAVFLSIKQISTSITKPLLFNTFVLISKSSFCIYLVHEFYNIVFPSLGMSITIFTPILSIPILSLINLLLSFFTYLVLSKIPVLNKYII